MTLEAPCVGRDTRSAEDFWTVTIRSVAPLRTSRGECHAMFQVCRSLLTPGNPCLQGNLPSVPTGMDPSLPPKRRVSIRQLTFQPLSPECQLLPQLQQAAGRDSRVQGGAPARNPCLSCVSRSTAPSPRLGDRAERARHLIGPCDGWHILSARLPNRAVWRICGGGGSIRQPLVQIRTRVRCCIGQLHPRTKNARVMVLEQNVPGSVIRRTWGSQPLVRRWTTRPHKSKSGCCLARLLLADYA
jgi:hypothetical protein